MYLFILFIVGMAGALVKDVLKDGYVQLPYLDGGKCYLGFLGSAFIGGCIGLAVDHSFLTAFLAGYVGFSVFENILIKTKYGQGLRYNNSSGS